MGRCGPWPSIERDLLRMLVPVDRRTSNWLREVLGPGVAPVRSLSFGISSELDLVQAAGGELFVLRRYVDRHVLEHHPDAVADEWRALEAAHAVLGTLVPRPIASDPLGEAAGDPALLMTCLPGAPVIHGLDPVRLVEPLSVLHAAPVPPTLPPYRYLSDHSGAHVPAWTTDPGSWARVLDVVARPEPAAPAVFIHRDFHPGNLLWEAGELTGIVDWTFACHGPVGPELAHTRCNLALVDGCNAAEAFLKAYVASHPSYRHDPWWDARELLVWIDDFSGVLAFNAFGAGLDVDLLSSRADDFAASVGRADFEAVFSA
jgi:hypothetical protein